MNNAKETTRAILKKYAPQIREAVSTQGFDLLCEEVLEFAGLKGQMANFNEPHLSLISAAKEEGARKALSSVRETLENIMSDTAKESTPGELWEHYQDKLLAD